MIPYSEFMERLTKLNKNVNDFFIKLIKAKNYSVTSMELLLLMKLSQDKQVTPQEIAQKGSGLFGHLRFLLQSLENKQLISIKSKGSNVDYNNSIITVEKQGKDIAQNLSSQTIPQDIVKSLENLEIYTAQINHK